MITFLRMCPLNGLRYPLVGEMRQSHFEGTNFKPRKLLENAQTPTSRVHAVLGGVCLLVPMSMVAMPVHSY